MSEGISRVKEANKITLAEFTYLAYFFVMFGARAAGLYEGRLIYNITVVAGMLLFALKIILTKHTLFEYLIMGALGALSLIVYYNTGEKGLLFYMTMMLGLKGVLVKRVFQWAAIILSACFSILILLTVSGLVQDIYYIHDRAFFGTVMRRSLGYPYPNTLFTTYIVLMVLIMYLLGRMKKKQLILVSLLEFTGALYMYLYSCSNTGIIVAAFFLVINYYFRTRKELTGAERAMVQMVYPGCILLTVAGPLLSGGRLFEFLDRFLHNRWNYARYYLTNEPVTLLGQRFKPAPNTNYLIDSSFLYSFLQIGLVAFVILTVLNMAMIYDYTKKDRRMELAIIVSFCILGLSDPFLYNLSYKNLLFLFIGEYFFRSLKKLQEKLPDKLLYELQWLKIGNKEIALDRLCPAKVRESFQKIGKALAEGSVYYTCLYFVSGILFAAAFYLFTDFRGVLTVADSIEKWEYIRAGVSVGIWCPVIVILGNIWAAGRKQG